MTLTYKIEFFTYWHCGSGLAAGADVDALVIKDKNGLPYIPGKTMKGLLREAVDLFLSLDKEKQAKVSNDYLAVFGFFDDKDKFLKSESFFSNAELSAEQQAKIKDGGLARFMFDSVSKTAIDENGIAKDHSLRKLEVTVPCTLYGFIGDVPDSMVSALTDAMAFIKCLGVGRNRGLGRCKITLEKGGSK